jgi:F-type H+-transporting ATPase subunit delta
LLATSQRDDVTAAVEEDLAAITYALSQKQEFKQTLESPRVARDAKLKLIDRVFSDRARPLTVRLLRMLVEKNRESELEMIYEAFVRLRQEAEGIIQVTIASAGEMSDAELARLVSRIESQTGKTVVFDHSIDPALIGGVTVRFGDSMIDGSVSGGLRRLREHLYIDVLKQS